MEPRPCALLSSRSSCSSLIASWVGLTCWALAGAASPAIMSTATAVTRIRIRAMSLVMVLSPCDRVSRRRGQHRMTQRRMATLSRRDGLAIRHLPAPGAGAVAALGDALLVDLRDDLAVAGE